MKSAFSSCAVPPGRHAIPILPSRFSFRRNDIVIPTMEGNKNWRKVDHPPQTAPFAEWGFRHRPPATLQPLR